ncbi:MAG: hypothetical protein WCO48_00925 [Candidatus Taylorbacteria bacterium]
MEQGISQKNIGIAISVVVIVGVIGSTILFGNHSKSVTPPVSAPTTPLQVSYGDSEESDEDGGVVNTPAVVNKPVVSTTPPPAITKKSVYAYKNGTYSANGSYMSPGGQDQLLVTLTIANDIVTSASVTVQSADRTSQKYISRFLSGYQSYVVGQDISTLNLTRISGSSLTPIGFNNALSQIKAQAKA